MRRVFTIQQVNTTDINIRPPPGVVWSLHYLTLYVDVTTPSATSGAVWEVVLSFYRNASTLARVPLDSTGVFSSVMTFAGYTETGGTGSIGNGYTRPTLFGADAYLNIPAAEPGTYNAAQLIIQLVEEGV